MSPTRNRRAAAAAGAVAVLAAGIALASPSAAQIPAPIDLIALRRDNTLVRFDPASPGTTLATVPVTGLGGDTLIGIDLRPADLLVYGVAADGSVYTIDPVTGAANAFATSAVDPGSDGGVDFNPVPSALRITDTGEQNLRLANSPSTNNLAVTNTDSPLNYQPGDPMAMPAPIPPDVNAGANPNIVGSAYTNSIAPSPRDAATQGGTQLFGIDSGLDVLVLQNPPNAGTLNTVGPLGVDTDASVGFDIHSTAIGSNTAYASLTVGGVAGLYTINLTTGTATLVGAIAGTGGAAIVGLTVVGELPPPAATTTTTAAVGGSTATSAPTGATPTSARVLARTGDEEGKGALLGGVLLAAGAAAVIAAGRLRSRTTA